MRQTIQLEAAPRLGVYFLCPGCERRLTDLYLRDSEFLCRKCHDLAYPSQLASVPRAERRLRQDVAVAWRERLRQRPVEAAPERPVTDIEEFVEAARRRREGEELERERQRRRRFVQRTGRPGRPREKRRYAHDDSRRVRLGPREAYCCHCRAARPYRYPRRAYVGTGTAIRARCRVCSTPVFRFVRPKEAEGLQEFLW